MRPSMIWPLNLWVTVTRTLPGRNWCACLFSTGKPDAPRTCLAVNRTSTAVQVNCEKGFDGGLPQEFTMELYSAARNGGTNGQRRIVSNITSRSKPEFVVTGLEPGAGYFVTVYSSNGKGRSATFTLSVSTLKSTHQEPRRTTGEWYAVSWCLVIIFFLL